MDTIDRLPGDFPKPIGYRIREDKDQLFQLQDRYIQRLQHAGCLWYNANPTKYCALLVSGKVSNGFVNFRQIYETGENINLLLDMCGALYAIYEDLFRNSSRKPLMDKISGTAYGALIPAFNLASRFHVGYGWTDKIEDPETGKSKGQVCKTDVKGKKVLLIEDVITTASSIFQSRDAIEQAGGSVIYPICCLFNRSGKSEIDGIPIIALINLYFEVYDPEESPWKGAQAIKPKLEGNWEKLIRQE